MRTTGLLGFALVPLSVWGQTGYTPMQALDPSEASSGPKCVASCEATLSTCRQMCEDTTARAAVEHFDEPDVPVPVCIRNCEADAAICKEDC